MIHPEIRITNLEPVGFGRLNSLVSRRDFGAPTQLTVLHDAGAVVQVVHSRDGVVDAHRAPVGDDRVAHAENLRTAAGVDRVVLLDRTRLDELAAEVVDIAASTRVQSELLIGAGERFWAHSAVSTSPPPPVSPWPVVQAALRRLADGWIELVAWDGEDPALALHARLQSGMVVELTSPSQPLAARTDYRSARPLVAKVHLEWSDLEAILLARSPVDELHARIEGGAVEHEGVVEALWPTS